MKVESPQPICPRCEAPVVEGARFCANCGQALGAEGAPAAAPQPVELAALTPPSAPAAPSPMVDRMRAARLSGERKLVTALFADVVGSTTLAERMDPEDWTAMMNAAFDQMSEAVSRYGGTVAQLQGDAVIAIFGAPAAHEDDPERAVRAALEMISGAEQFARELRATHGIDFRIRAGINSGPAVVGSIGGDVRHEYSAFGDTMNVAARMQTAAQPGTVLITAATQRFVAEAFDVEDLGEIEVKGKSEPVHAFRVIAARAAPGRQRGLERAGLESPMVGRDSQLAILESLYEVVEAGRGRVAFLVGEPGIGKSRLLAEFHRWSTGEAGGRPDGTIEPAWIEGRCVSYGQSVPYHLLIDVVRSALGIPAAAPEAEARAVLDASLAAELGAEAPDTAPYLAHLLGLPLRPAEAERGLIDPGVMQARYAASLVRLLRQLSTSRPVVLVCEDLHWADPASIEVMTQVMPLAAQHAVLLLGALRAERDAPGWRLVTGARDLFGDALAEISLRPLSNTESRDLVANLLEIESLPERVRELILARAEGNPFFVEEVIRMLIERGMIERHGERWVATSDVGSAEIPETLHGLLLARIDQLPESAKQSLRVASVIGRQFAVRVLERVLAETPA